MWIDLEQYDKQGSDGLLENAITNGSKHWIPV